MTDGCCNTFFTTIVEGYDTAVGEWQLDFALALLTSNLTRHGTVHLVGQPVLASHSLQLKHLLQVFIYLVERIRHVLVLAHHGLILHICLWRMSKHLTHFQVERTHTISLFESEMCITRCLTHHIQWSTLTLSNLAHMLNVLFLNEQAHALLTFVGNDFLR